MVDIRDNINIKFEINFELVPQSHIVLQLYYLYQ